jgi:cobalt-zinc-cadmium efflux system outer membrane protein
MRTRSRVLAWIVAFGLLTPAVAAAQERTERDVVDLIVLEGPQAAAIRAQTDVTQRTQLSRLTYPNPAVMYSREGAGFTEFLQVEQSLPVFGRRAAVSRAGAAANAAADAERDARLWTLRADASVLVARLLAEQARLEAVDSHAREVERLIQILRVRELEGEGSRFDRLRAEHELRDARQLLTSSRVALAAARSALAAMLPADTTVSRIAGALHTSHTPVLVETLLARAPATRAELRAFRQSAERASLESDAARRARLPEPALFGGLKRAGAEPDREQGTVFGLRVSVPLFDAGGRDAARWMAERARVEAERASLEQQIRTEIVRAADALALRETALVEDQEEDAEELTGIAVVAYREGEVGILELLDAVRTASRARLRRIDLRLDARLAQVALERAVGEVLWP